MSTLETRSWPDDPEDRPPGRHIRYQLLLEGIVVAEIDPEVTATVDEAVNLQERVAMRYNLHDELVVALTFATDCAISMKDRQPTSRDLDNLISSLKTVLAKVDQK